MSAVTAFRRAAVTGDELRHGIGHLATGVTIVTSLDNDGDPVGTTASAVSSLSMSPPLVLVCLGRSSATLAAIRARREFAINVLGSDQHELSDNFARPGAVASWDAVAHGRWPSGMPRLDNVLSALDCVVENVLDGGDHLIVVGRVLAVDVSDGARQPLLHFRGTYARLEAA
jgi:flavin reductase (DIM6/NTAB) family NADH-FMN oxidoreductase RutF